MLLLVFIGLPVLFQTGFWFWRPMFYNQFVMHDGLPFYHWWPQGSYYDRRGNAAIADYERNLLVVFLTADSSIPPSRFAVPSSRRGGVAFPELVGEDAIDFFVPNCTNTLFVFGADGVRERFPLLAAEAEHIHKQMGPGPVSDLVQTLVATYAKKHSPAATARLSATVNELQHTAATCSQD